MLANLLCFVVGAYVGFIICGLLVANGRNGGEN